MTDAANNRESMGKGQNILQRREPGFFGVLGIIKLNLVHMLLVTLDHGFDFRYGADTSRPVPGPQLGVDHYQCRRTA